MYIAHCSSYIANYISLNFAKSRAVSAVPAQK